MGLFGYGKKPAARQQPARGYSLVDDRLTIRGEIDTDGTVRIDGRIEGTIHRAGTLIVGAGGGVIGDVEAREVIVAGVIEGNVRASGRVEIEAGAAVHGEIRADAMQLHEGGAVHGLVLVGAASSAIAATGQPAPTRRLEIAQPTPAAPVAAVPAAGRAHG